MAFYDRFPLVCAEAVDQDLPSLGAGVDFLIAQGDGQDRRRVPQAMAQRREAILSIARVG